MRIDVGKVLGFVGCRKGQREAEDAMRLLRHGQVVAESLLQPSVWQGRLKLHCSTPEVCNAQASTWYLYAR